MFRLKSKEAIEQKRKEQVLYEFEQLALSAGINAKLRDDTNKGYWSVFIWTKSDANFNETTILPEPIQVPEDLSAQDIVWYLQKNKPEYFL